MPRPARTDRWEGHAVPPVNNPGSTSGTSSQYSFSESLARLPVTPDLHRQRRHQEREPDPGHQPDGPADEEVTAAEAGCPNNNWAGVTPVLTVTSVTLVIEQPVGTVIFSCSATNPNGITGTVALAC
jgi:hypothetical protein